LPRSKAAVLHASSTSVRGHWHLLICDCDEMHGPATTAGAFASATWRPSQSLRTCARACSQGRIQGERERRRLTGPPVHLLLSMRTERTPTGLISMRAGAAPYALRQWRGGNGISPGNFVWGYGHRWRAAAADTAHSGKTSR